MNQICTTASDEFETGLFEIIGKLSFSHICENQENKTLLSCNDDYKVLCSSWLNDITEFLNSFIEDHPEDIHDELEKYNGNLYSLTTAYHTLASREEHYKALSEELQRKLDEPLPPLKEQLKAQARRWLDKGVEYLAVAAITLVAVGIIAGVALL